MFHKKQTLCRARYDYRPQESNEIGFKTGSTIVLIEKHNGDWWEGEIDGKRGLFPANRVEEIESLMAENPIPPIMAAKPSIIKKKDSYVGPVELPGMQPNVEQRMSTPSIMPDDDTTSNMGSLSNFAPGSSVKSKANFLQNQTSFSLPSFGEPPKVRVRVNSTLSQGSSTSSGPTSAPNLIAELKQRRPESSVLEGNSIAEELNKRLAIAAGLSASSMRARVGSNPPVPMHMESQLKVSPLPQQGTISGDESPLSLSEDNLNGVDDEFDQPVANLEAAQASEVKKEGFLQRRNGDDKKMTLRAWKSFWTELAGSCLYFYKDSQSKKKEGKKDKPIKMIDIRQARLDFSSNLDKKKYSFAITTGKGEALFLAAKDEADFLSWQEVLLEVSGVKKESIAEQNQTVTKRPSDSNSKAEATPKIEKKSVLKRAQPELKKKSSSANVIEDDLPEADRKAFAKKSLLGWLTSRPPLETLKEKGIITEDSLFGGDLALHVQKDQRKIPLVVEQCIQHIESKGLDFVGIYRLSGNLASIQKLRFMYNEGRANIDLTAEEFADINIITGLVKLYFRELQQPLFTFEKYDPLVNASKIQDVSTRVAQMRELVKKLPKTNYETLCFLMKHLVKVAKLSDSNKMDATNLGIVFGPTLMRPQVESFESILNTAAHSIVVETIINHFDAIFR